MNKAKKIFEMAVKITIILWTLALFVFFFVSGFFFDYLEIPGNYPGKGAVHLFSFEVGTLISLTPVFLYSILININKEFDYIDVVSGRKLYIIYDHPFFTYLWFSFIAVLYFTVILDALYGAVISEIPYLLVLEIIVGLIDLFWVVYIGITFGRFPYDDHGGGVGNTTFGGDW